MRFKFDRAKSVRLKKDSKRKIGFEEIKEICTHYHYVDCRSGNSKQFRAFGCVKTRGIGWTNFWKTSTMSAIVAIVTWEPTQLKMFCCEKWILPYAIVALTTRVMLWLSATAPKSLVTPGKTVRSLSVAAILACRLTRIVTDSISDLGESCRECWIRVLRTIG